MADWEGACIANAWLLRNARGFLDSIHVAIEPHSQAIRTNKDKCKERDAWDETMMLIFLY